MISRYLYFSLLLLILNTVTIVGQESNGIYQQRSNLELAHHYFNLDLYGQARLYAQKYINQTPKTEQINILGSGLLQAHSIYYISGLRIDVPEGESELASYITENQGNPLVLDAIFEMGDYYYNEKQYDNCINYFEKIDVDMLTEERMSELAFKKGYCHFVRKEFQKAQYEFSYSRNIKNKFFYPINYYHGMCEYFNGQYDDAVSSFQRVEGSSVYAKHIPYYICQIYFSEKKYDKLITYGERMILDKSIRKTSEIRLLLGQTYFLRNDYTRALPHLENYESETAELTVEEFYQLAFAQYKLGKYEPAIENFLEINREDNMLGQLVNYYLADCYINTGDKTSARAAFKQVSQMNYGGSMQEEANFNYGKLSSQMGFEREAINVLMDVSESSPYYSETQSIINDILEHTSDYQNAIEILENLPSLNQKLKTTYQKVTHLRAVQLLSEDDPEQSMQMFTKSDTYPIDKNINAQTSYWRGYVTMSVGDHPASLNYYQQYFLQIKETTNMPEESDIYMAHYNQGYNHLKLEEYYFAVDQFQFAINDIQDQQKTFQNKAIIERVLPDAYVRAGDCLFKEKRYKQAMSYYDGAIDIKKGDYVYALYQRALIEGLEHDNYSKIVTLEQIIDDHPNSDYADDAMLLLGDTYLNTQNPGPAADVYQKLVKRYQGKSNLVNSAYLKLGLITYNEGDARLALKYYKKIFDNNPNPQESQEALLAIEEIYIDDLAKGDEFIAYVDSLPGYEINAFTRDSINYKVGENKYNNAEYTEAITAFNTYLSKYSSGYYRLEAHYYRGECLVLKKKYQSSLRDYEAIIEEGISDYYERALKKAAIISYNYTQNFSKALNYYTALEQQTNNPEDKFQAQLGAMRSAFRLGKDAKVITYADLVNKNRLSSTAEKSTAMYYLGKTSYKNQNLDQAISAFKQVSQLSTNNQAAEARYLIANAYYKQGNMEGAEQQITDANSKNSAYPYWIAKSLLLMTDIFIDRDDLLNARAAAEAVLENFKDDENLVVEANAKLSTIKDTESQTNRIRTENPDGTLQLDTTGN